VGIYWALPLRFLRSFIRHVDSWQPLAFRSILLPMTIQGTLYLRFYRRRSWAFPCSPISWMSSLGRTIPPGEFISPQPSIRISLALSYACLNMGLFMFSKTHFIKHKQCLHSPIPFSDDGFIGTSFSYPTMPFPLINKWSVLGRIWKTYSHEFALVNLGPHAFTPALIFYFNPNRIIRGNLSSRLVVCF
jgi:hypothetical protein